MPVLTCPACSAAVAVARDELGREGSCPKCGVTFRMGEAGGHFNDNRIAAGDPPRPDRDDGINDAVFFLQWLPIKGALETLVLCTWAMLFVGIMTPFTVMFLLSAAPVGPDRLLMFTILAGLATLVIGIVALTAMMKFLSAPDAGVRTRARWTFRGIAGTVLTCIAAVVLVAVPVISRQPLDGMSLALVGFVVTGLTLLTLVAWIMTHAAVGVALGDRGVTRTAWALLAGVLVLTGLGILVNLWLEAQFPARRGPMSMMAQAFGIMLSSIVINSVEAGWYIYLCRRTIRALTDPAPIAEAAPETTGELESLPSNSEVS